MQRGQGRHRAIVLDLRQHALGALRTLCHVLEPHAIEQARVPQPCTDPQFHPRPVGILGRLDTYLAGSCNSLHVVCSKRRHWRSEEHTSELQSLTNLVCRLLLEKKKIQQINPVTITA